MANLLCGTISLSEEEEEGGGGGRQAGWQHDPLHLGSRALAGTGGRESGSRIRGSLMLLAGLLFRCERCRRGKGREGQMERKKVWELYFVERKVEVCP